jgi:thioredoxin reductase (NADPH)
MKDLIIIGAGPAGLSASIYASRYKLDHMVIGSEIGGQCNEAWEVENYPGFEHISGKELTEKMFSHAKKFGAQILQTSVKNIVKSQEGFKVLLSDETELEGKSILLALGMKAKKMNIKGEKELIGKGVSYCATCDAMFFRGKDVVVVGGGDSAISSAIHLKEFASNVTLLYKDELTCEPALLDSVSGTEGIKLECCADILEIKGSSIVEGIIYEQEGKSKELAVQGVFIEIGTVPGTVLVGQLGVITDEQGYVVTDDSMMTNIENVYAAGDMTTGSNKFRQIVTACAEGAVAAGSVYKKLKIAKK